MNYFVRKHEKIWNDNPLELLKEYDYHQKITEKLDALDPETFNRETLFEIVLWKLSRIPYVSDELLNELKSVSTIAPKRHELAREVLEKLLRSNGIALPMASTILRFLNPNAFQIIDERAYRVLFSGEEKYPSKTSEISDAYIKNSISIYFDYLTKIHEVSCEALPFRFADRILYQLDINLGNKIGDISPVD